MMMMLTAILIVDYVRIRVDAKVGTTADRTDQLYPISKFIIVLVFVYLYLYL